MRLNRELILDTAVELLDSYGLADVTMRRVAGAIGVAPGALYWHIENKQKLISAMAGRILSPVLEPADSAAFAGPDGVEALMDAFRTAVLAHRDGAEVVSAALSTPPLQAKMLEQVRTAVAAAGVSDDAALPLLHFGIGAVVSEQAAAQLAGASGDRPGSGDGEADFHRGVRIILSGAAR